ncbi:cytochrome P450, family 81, subfamily K, polypeptide 2 [Hibiscus trionum]|uniref:Cytochrome P450, family 81, subfamily K, polypeptide 2 n=1 Tax=Hibiscus trionum TaxID=183268 RepID=A0A9W7HUG9_HIBTR|nr:cytochrome P450, family 81, subfamily K, polypeptide 2 [Hibiscus trionum]
MENLYNYLCTIFFVFLIVKLLTSKKQNLPPTPFSLPIIGHFHLLKPPLYKALATLLSKYGPILFLRVGSRRILVVSSPSAVEECLSKNDVIFANRPRTMAGDIFMYNQRAFVWASYGPLWRNLRRVNVVEVLSSFGVQKFSSVREEEVGNAVHRLFQSSAVNGGVSPKVDMKYLFGLLTMNVIMKVTSGKCGVEAAGAAGDDEDAEKMSFQEFRSLFFPSLGTNICDFFPVLKWIGFRGIEKGLKEIHRRRDEYLQKLVDGVRSKSDREKNSSFIGKLLSLQEEDPNFFTDEIIRSMALIMFIAGTETTAITMEWAMSLLLNHPAAMEKVRAEIVDNVGHEHMLNDSDLAKLPYLHCVVNETLRLYPPAPVLLPHYSSEDCTVGGYDVPKGTLLIVNVWAIHRDPSLWADPTEFKPERFEARLEEKEGSKFLPFGLGRRACPGATMSTRLVLLALGAAIQCFEWKNVGSGEVDMTPGAGQALSKATPLEAICSPRPGLMKLLSQM